MAQIVKGTIIAVVPIAVPINTLVKGNKNTTSKMNGIERPISIIRFKIKFATLEGNTDDEEFYINGVHFVVYAGEPWPYWYSPSNNGGGFINHDGQYVRVKYETFKYPNGNERNYIMEIYLPFESVDEMTGTAKENEDENKNVWDSFKGKMSDDQYLSLQKFTPLFDENENFYFYPDGEDRSFKEFVNYNEGTWTVSDFSLVDMDGDENDELILYTDFGPGSTFVISVIDERYYGMFFTAREMRDIQNNGYYIGNGGSGREYFNKLEISKEKMEPVTFEQKPGDDEENRWTEEYYEKFLKENYSDPATKWELKYVVE